MVMWSLPLGTLEDNVPQARALIVVSITWTQQYATKLPKAQKAAQEAMILHTFGVQVGMIRWSLGRLKR